MLPWFACFCLVASLTGIAIWAAKPLMIVPRMRSRKRATDIYALLSPPNVPLGDLLAARAAPNQRLVHAFGLTNTFVSGDIKIHRSFTTDAKVLISRAGDKENPWRAVALSAEATARQFLPQSGVTFSTLIQCITFSVVLSALFNIDLDTLRYDDVVCATNIINQRWTDSKTKDAAEMRRDDSLRSLTEYLDRWITDKDRYPNPLNFILPAYETMWRVVATTVAYIYRCSDNSLHDVVTAFGRDPTETRFAAFGEDGLQPSMQSIVFEVLRLHPPTRHIVRMPTRSGPESWWRALVATAPRQEIADIEGVHLSERYGKNAAHFDPMRFHPSRMGCPDLLSFGYGRLKCIAAGWAPMAAAIIAATIILQIDEERYTVTIGPKIGGRSGWEGWKVCKEAE